MSQNAPHVPAWLLKCLPALSVPPGPLGFSTKSNIRSAAEGWGHESKLDGYRCLAHAKAGGGLRSRAGTEWTDRLPELASLTAVDDVVLAKPKHKLEQRLQVARWRPSTPARPGPSSSRSSPSAQTALTARPRETPRVSQEGSPRPSVAAKSRPGHRHSDEMEH